MALQKLNFQMLIFLPMALTGILMLDNLKLVNKDVECNSSLEII